MKFLKKSLGLIFLLLLAPVFIAADVQKDVSSQAAPTGTKKPFTVDNSLALEFLNYWSYPRFASSGNFVAYAVVDKYYGRSREEEAGRFFIPQGSHIFVGSLEGGRPLQLTEGAEYSWSPCWSPDGNKLAFYGLHDNKVSIGLWDRITGRKESFEAGNLYGRGSIEWDPQNQKIFFSSNPSEWKGPLEPYEDSEDPIVRTTGQETNPYDERFMSAYTSQLTSLDLQTKKTAVITPRPMEVLSSKFSPNRKHVAVLEIVKNKIRVLDGYSGETGHSFRFKTATDRSEATLDGHYTSLWPE